MDETTAAILRDTLRSSTPVIPTIPNPYQYLQQGFQTAAALESARQADQRSQAAAQSLVAEQQRIALEWQKMDLALQTNPYQLALLQEKVRLLPQDRKYNQQFQQAGIDYKNAQTEHERTLTRNLDTAAPILDPVQPPPPRSAAGESGVGSTTNDAEAPAAAAPRTPTPSTFDKPISLLGGGTADAPVSVPLSANDTPIPSAEDDDADGPITLPSFASMPSDIANGNLVAVSGADNPKTTTVYRGGKRVQGPNIALPDAPADKSDLPQPDDSTTAEPGSTPSAIPVAFGGTMQTADGTGGGSDAGAAGELLGYHVPTSEADAKAQRDYFNQRMASALSHPGYVANPRNQKLVEAQLRAENQALARAEAQFENNRSNARATSRTASRSTGSTRAAVDPDADAPERDGFTFVPRKFAPRVGVSGEYLSADELREMHAKADSQETANAEKRISNAAAGATPQEFQNAQEVPPAQPGGPKQYVVTHTDTRNGQDFEVKRTLSEPVYNALMAQLQPTMYGKANKPASTGPTSAQAISALSTDPNFLRPDPAIMYPQTTAALNALRAGDSEFPASTSPPAFTMAPATPGGALPIHLGLGPAAMIAGGRLPPPPAAVPAAVNTGSALDTAASQFQPQNQAERDAAAIVQQTQAKQKQQDVTDAANTNEHAKGPHDLEVMLQRHHNNEAGRLNDAQDDLTTLVAIKKYRDAQAELKGSPYKQGITLPPKPTGVKADAFNYAPDAQLGDLITKKLEEVQQRRARVAAASDVRNYSATPNGFQYVDPFDGSNLVTAFSDIPTGSGQVKVTKSQ